MGTDPEAFRVPLDGFEMHLRPSELEAVSAHLGPLPAGPRADALLALAEAVRTLPVRDRAPLWELAIRHYARAKPLDRAAAEIGMDALHARTLLDTFTRALSTP